MQRALASEAKTAVLNPMVELRAVDASLDTLDETFLRQFSLVILVDQPYQEVEKLDVLCRQNNIKFINSRLVKTNSEICRFMAGCVFGWVGYSFFDFDGVKFQT